MQFGKKPHESAEWLRGVAFFDGFGSDDLQRVLALSTEQIAAPGDTLIDQGDAGVDCFVIVSGSAAVFIGGEYVTSVPAGSMIGEMALVDHRPRVATVVANEEMKLLRFDARHFRQLLDEMPKASERVMTLLHDRMVGPPAATTTTAEP